jgi:hypothetical protein
MPNLHLPKPSARLSTVAPPCSKTCREMFLPFSRGSEAKHLEVFFSLELRTGMTSMRGMTIIKPNKILRLTYRLNFPNNNVKI